MSTGSNDMTIEYFARKLFNEKDRKIVTIWGAGTSIKSGVPSGHYLMQRMRRDLSVIIDSEYCREILRERHAEISEVIRQDQKGRISFEYVMWVYGLVYGRDKLHLWLKEFIRPMSDYHVPPYLPGFSHEYCSHLAKHELLKYFISTNFDEILESSLEEELGREKVKVIASKSEFESLRHSGVDGWTRNFGSSRATCFLFKPHGTISRSLTLRDTPEGVSHFEEEKRDVLSEVLRDAIIVFLGFGNYNENFWLLFGETYSMGLTSDIVIVDINPEQVRAKLPDERMHNEIYEYSGEVDTFFEELYTKHKGQPGKQTPIRHFLRSRYFGVYNRKLTRIEEEQEYRRKLACLKHIAHRWWYDVRTYELELLIYMFKSRGLFIQLAVSDCPRVKRAYSKCLEWKQKHAHECAAIAEYNLEPTEVLRTIFNEGYPEPYFNRGEVIDKFNEKAINIYWCFMTIPKALHASYASSRPTRDEDIDRELGQLQQKYCAEVARRYIAYLVDKARCDCGQDAKRCIEHCIEEQDFENVLCGGLMELLNDYDVDIVDTDLSASMRFEAPTIITSRKMLDDTTKALLSLGDRLRVTSFSAEWLITMLKHNDAVKHIDIISNISAFKKFADGDSVTEPIDLFHYQKMMFSITKLIRELRRNDAIPSITIDWYAIRHLQHHMTIATKADNGETAPKAIYFRRPGKNAEISPVLLTKPSDIDVLIEYFDTRIQKLKKTTDQGGKILQIRKARKKVHVSINESSSPLDLQDELKHLKNIAYWYLWPR